jgi:Skp family chaperone for outer membrane proteins
MKNQTLISVGSAVGVVALVAAILFAGTQTPAQQPAAAPTVPGSQMILTVDRAAVLRSSLVGKDLIRQIDEFKASLEAKFGDEEKKLRADAQALQEQAGVLSPEAAAKKEKELRDRDEALRKKMQDEQAAIQNGIGNAQRELDKALGPILNAVFQERKGSILLERAAVIIGPNDIDITASVIQRLDQVLPAIKVTPVAPDPNVPAAPAAGQ